MSAEVELQQREFIPGDQPVRSGDTQIMPWEHFDTPFSGYGQLFDLQKGVSLFNDAERCKDDLLCSLEKPGEFANDTEFHAFAFCCEVEFSDPSLYEVFVHYVQVRLIKGKTVKNYLWMSRLGGGGGVAGTDQNSTSFHLSNGKQDPRAIYNVGSIPWIFSPGKTWKLLMHFLQLEGLESPDDARQPGVIFNADLSGEEEDFVRKLVRFFMRGDQYSDTINQ